MPAGFPSPAADHTHKRIDLNEHLIRNGDATHVFRVRGDSMTGIGIYEGEVTTQPITKSIEGTLFEIFGILSPANHYLSEKVTFILNELVQQRQDLETTHAELRRLWQLSEDTEQKEFLDRAIELAVNVKEKLKPRGDRL